MCVMFLSLSKSKKCGPGASNPGGSIKSVEPASKAHPMSETEASKFVERTKSELLFSLNLNASICAERKFHIPACGTITPFGRPVEPEV